MDAAHIHLVINHAPVIGGAIGAGVLAVGLARANPTVLATGKVILAAVAAVTVPTFLTGEPAAHQLGRALGFDRGLVHAHEDAAVVALVAMLAAGVIAAGLLVRARAHRGAHAGLLAVTVGALVLMGRASNLGGQIQHAELRAAAAPTAASADAPPGRPTVPAAALAEVPEPPELRSRAGRLDATIEAGPAMISVAGHTYTSNVYDGRYIPPVLVVKRGDLVNLRFVNNVGKADYRIDGPEPSNIHTHGLAIPPVQPADAVFFTVPSGSAAGTPPAAATAHMHHETPERFPDGTGFAPPNAYAYQWTVPAHHSLGPFWYHPHAHGMAEDQVMSGMSGMLIVDGFIDTHYPELTSLTQRRFLLKDLALPGAADGAPLTKTINGVVGGAIRLRPGETQIWELGHVGADAFFDLVVDGHTFVALSHDANPLEAPVPTPSVFLGAGARATVAITAGAPGTYALRSRAVDTGPAGDPNPEVILAQVVVEGAPVDRTAVDARLRQPAARLDDIDPTVAQVKALPVTRRRTIRFTESADGKTFFIDGREFAPDRDDVTVTVGDVEVWTLLNETTERHVFHIHQIDFLVMALDDDEPDATGLRDTIDMPYMRDGKPGKVVLKMPFTNPAIVGRFPFHCHILEHEDHGMMAILRVLPAPAAPAPGRP